MMKYVLVHYKVKKNKVTLIKKAIRNFIRAIKKKEKETLFYEAFQHDDNVSFTHFMTFKNAKAEAFHRKTPHVKTFVNILYPNCIKKPVFKEVKAMMSTKRK